ncbi:Glucose-methanol-choline oxidoreductase, C-terminal [Artemisia annua]|uniref:Glucose-methanol-choline oxidoreductase, C-terminal n=1 Tax=Artemisia annua TaxID=35608 RepID=A0A2U1MKQ8_ARTAN|nr:Glucose-methanol-choline oxidoreductase, C-terminal [Artemisia annua]
MDELLSYASSEKRNTKKLIVRQETTTNRITHTHANASSITNNDDHKIQRAGSNRVLAGYNRKITMPVTGQYRTTVGVLMAKEERHSAADLLNLAKGSNIKVAVYAILERILFDGLRDVIGVLFRDNVGRLNLAMLREDGEKWDTFLSPMLLQQSLIQVVGITDSGAYLEASFNVLPSPSPVHTVFMRPQSSPLYYSIVSIMEKIIGPLSAGSMRLASPEIIMNPIVWFNYFSNAVDLQRRTVNTIWHYHGGCLVGRVVDSELRVLGVGSLQVIDGSVFSNSNQSTCYCCDAWKPMFMPSVCLFYGTAFFAAIVVYPAHLVCAGICDPSAVKVLIYQNTPSLSPNDTKLDLRFYVRVSQYSMLPSVVSVILKH